MEIFDPEFSAANIAPTVLIRLCAVAEERGVDPEQWFLGTGVLPGRLDSPAARVSYRQATTIIRRAVRAMPEGALGLEVGSRDSTVTYGMLGFAMRSSRTAGDAMALASEMSGLAGTLTDFGFSRRGELSTLRVFERVPDPELVRFLTEQAIAAALSFGRSLVGDGVEPVGVRLSYPEPAYAADYRRYFRCPVEFGSGVSELDFRTELFTRPIPTYNRAGLTVAVEACRRMAGGGAAGNDVVASVESILGENLRRSMSMSEVAERLFITERTLRRRLRSAGAKYIDIRDRVRQRRALFLVRETGMTIVQIAAETGYRDAREFRRAYVRWKRRAAEPDTGPRRARVVHRRYRYHRAATGRGWPYRIVTRTCTPLGSVACTAISVHGIQLRPIIPAFSLISATRREVSRDIESIRSRVRFTVGPMMIHSRRISRIIASMPMRSDRRANRRLMARRWRSFGIDRAPSDARRRYRCK
ncbi:AraC family transcriptional regulator ligand-binding domain-containing protein [Nocardia seriolae]|uniref:AraC family transcriptional regulator ligand-binding domain-containing protein n=1 Tax=Nocardia seriolae TaxID=37332 RepID=UPI0018AD1372|nr:AraC family transcriptional regulator ligand-binding domain-containing protein [Nocardia seriolae]